MLHNDPTAANLRGSRLERVKQTSTVYSQYHMALSLRVFSRVAFGTMAKIGSSSS
jgi:hypothetical protein